MHSVKEVDDYVSTLIQDANGAMSTGFIVRVVTETTTIKAATERVEALCHHPVNFNSLQTKVRRTFYEFKKLRSHNFRLESNRNALYRFLTAPFVIPAAPSTFVPAAFSTVLHDPASTPPGNQVPLAPSTSVSTVLLPAPPPVRPSASSQIQPAPSTVHLPDQSVLSPGTSNPSANKDLRRDCAQCAQRRASSTDRISQLKHQLTLQRSKICTLKSVYQVKTVNQFKRRKSVQIDQRKAELREQAQRIAELEKIVSTQEAEIASHVETIRELRQNLEQVKAKQTVSMKQDADVKRLKREVAGLKRDLEAAVECASDNSSSDLETRQDGKTYSDGLRKVVYNCLMSQVPIESTSSVIKYTLQTLTRRTPSSLPDPSTVAQMALEMGVLSDLQVGELFSKATVVNLAWDATTLDGRHINEIHVSSPSESLTLTTQEIPGGTAADYADQIIKALQQIESMYAHYASLDLLRIQTSFRSKILSTLTDRAAANHATVVLLEGMLNVELLELKCHLHPLDGLANAARSCLKELDKAKQKSSQSFGADCCAANLLYAISKLRYKAKGDPTSFKAFLRSKGKSTGILVRFVGNRLHVLFHLAGIVYLHQDLLVEYLEAYCNAAALGSAVLKDLRDTHIKVHLCALGWMGKLITGPWMALIYTPMLERSHLLMIKYLQVCVKKVEELADYPEAIYSSEEDIFGKPLMTDDTLLALRRADASADLLSTISSLASSFKALLQRQLERYLTGQLSQPDTDTEHRASAAPVHNIWAERCLGMVDAQVKRAPNATMEFVDCKVRCKINHTLQWLEKKPPSVQTSIISYAVKGAAAKRKQDKDRQLALEKELIRRMRERGQKRDTAARNRLCRSIKAAFGQGGLGLEDPAFNSLDPVVTAMLKEARNEPTHLIGQTMKHLWNEDGSDVIYMGSIQTVKDRKKGLELTVSYWLASSETAQDGVDYKISYADFLTDIVLGDLQMILN